MIQYEQYLYSCPLHDTYPACQRIYQAVAQYVFLWTFPDLITGIKANVNTEEICGKTLKCIKIKRSHAQAQAIYVHTPYDMSLKNQDGYRLKNIPCDLLLHINCSIHALARRVFYGAVKLGSLYGSNSKNHYCFFHLILIKRLSVAKLVHISVHTRRRIVCIFEDAHFYLWNEGSFGRALWSWLHFVYSNYWILTNV